MHMMTSLTISNHGRQLVRHQVCNNCIILIYGTSQLYHGFLVCMYCTLRAVICIPSGSAGNTYNSTQGKNAIHTRNPWYNYYIQTIAEIRRRISCLALRCSAMNELHIRNHKDKRCREKYSPEITQSISMVMNAISCRHSRG